MRRVGDWMRLSTGDRVVDVNDPRHVGRLDHIRWGHEAKVTWENGLISWLPLASLMREDRWWRNRL